MSRVALALALLVIGAGWALTVPLAKIAVSTGYQPLGLIFWQTTIGVAILGLILLVTGARFRPTRAQWAIALMIALTGTILPNAFSYRAAVHLPAGVIALLLSLVPMMAFPMALALGTDRTSPRRLVGLALGLGATLLIVLPEASLPDRAMLVFVPLALVAPAFYALEGNLVARFGTAGMDAVQTLCLASVLGALIAAPLAVATGQFIIPRSFGAPEAALAGSAAIHALVYSGYVWMVGRAGPVFAVQVSYLVTIFGMVWSMALLGERFSPGLWASLALMLAGMALVQPRARDETTPPLPGPPPDA
ncbi:DMT family transporter [Pseudooceanicola onchidii]|uniref:DMT family transporter n=1 Tax=Pseudooceanicola onchidii TaxID=2562279 RepID=UPI0010AB349C|nr:DMT family transporter [Pseudooceanicola onchidii]